MAFFTKKQNSSPKPDPADKNKEYNAVLMQLMEYPVPFLERGKHEPIWEFLERKAARILEMNRHFDSKKTDRRQTKEEQQADRARLKGLFFHAGHDDEAHPPRSTWDTGIVQTGVAPGTLDLDEHGRVAHSRFRVNGKEMFHTVFRTKAPAEWQVILLGRIVPRSEFFRIMNLPYVERWSLIDKLTRDKDLATTPVRIKGHKENASHRQNGSRPPEDEALVGPGSRKSDELIVRVVPKNKNLYLNLNKDRRKEGHDIETVYGSGINVNTRTMSKKSLRKQGLINGLGGGSTEGGVPEGTHSDSPMAMSRIAFVRRHLEDKPRSFAALFHEIGHAMTPTPQTTRDGRKDSLLTPVPGVPENMYYRIPSEMLNALRTVKQYGAHRLDYIPSNFDMVENMYEALWGGPNANEEETIRQRARLPKEVKRLFYHFDEIHKRGNMERLRKWVDENNLMNQVANEYDKLDPDEETDFRLA